MKKRIPALVLALVMICTLCACGTPSPAKSASAAQTETSASATLTEASVPVRTGDITILYTNDVHCGVSDNLGYSGLAVLKNSMEEQGNDVMLVDCGDSIQGDAIGTLSDGEYIIDIMNEAGYDIAIPGNHEYDYGTDQFIKKLVNKANFEYICCNFTDKDGKTIFKPYTVREIGGVKLGFVGILTPKTLTSSNPIHFKNEAGEYIYGFMMDETGETLYKAVQESVDAVRVEGAEYVIALAHLGIHAEVKPWTSSEVIENTSGIDVMLDGHSHSVIPQEKVKNKKGEEVILSSTGTKLAYVGCLTIDTGGKMSTCLIDDSGMSKFVKDVQSQFNELTSTVVAKTEVDLVINDPVTGVRLVRNNETNLGDLCADAYRCITGADIGICNGGGVRDTIAAGDITYGDIIRVFPFGNMLDVIEISGQELLDVLELSVSHMPGDSGGFLQVSGMTFTVDMNVPSSVKLNADNAFESVEGERRVKDVMIGDKPLDPDKIYTLASHNYMIKDGGDGYSMFADNKIVLDDVIIDNQALIDYIVNNLGGKIGEEYADPYGQGRITIIPAG